MSPISSIVSRLDEVVMSAGSHVNEDSLKSLAAAVAVALCAESCVITLSDAGDCVDEAPQANTNVLVAPIVAGVKRYGSIRVSGAANGLDSGVNDVESLQLIAWCIARAVESIRLQCVLRSRFTQLALISVNRRSIQQVVEMSAQHPNKIARLLARTFYRELTCAGFTCHQIINAATEIVSQLNAHLQQRKGSMDIYGSARRNG